MTESQAYPIKRLRTTAQLGDSLIRSLVARGLLDAYDRSSVTRASAERLLAAVAFLRRHGRDRLRFSDVMCELEHPHPYNPLST